MREVVSIQALAWLCRAAAFWFLLDAFRMGGSVRNVLLVFGVSQVAGAVPFTPGGAGVQQALLVQVFASRANAEIVAAYSVGQQIAIAVFTASVGFIAMVLYVWHDRDPVQIIRGGGDSGATEAPRAPHARA